MKRSAVVVAPGRGTYNKAELGYLKRHHAEQSELIGAFDGLREAEGQKTLTELDGEASFGGHHLTGDNASALIHACAYLDFMAIDRARYDIVAVTGNSMGWYITLACAAALDALGGLRVVNTMGRLMHEKGTGGQLIYPFVDENWRPVPDMRQRVLDKAGEINARDGHALMLSIDLGGMLVLAGDDSGLAAFEAEMPTVQERFPLRLPNHAAFHTPLLAPIAQEGQSRLPASLFGQPKFPMIDGRGAIWMPGACDLQALWSYTFGHQVVRPYDFRKAITVAAREFMPDVFIVLGPGNTLGGVVGQALVRANWRGMDSKSAFQEAQAEEPPLLAMGFDEQREMVV